jgi:hypothetical protein
VGAHSTIEIGRDAALRYLVVTLLVASNEKIEAVMELFVRDRLFNVYVIPGTGRDDDKLGSL